MPNISRTIHGDRATLPHDKQPKRVIQIGVGEDYGLKDIVSCRPGFWSGQKGNLLANIRRCIDKKPAFAIRAKSDARLGAFGYLARSRFLTVDAPAVPLRDASAGGRSKELYAQ